LRHRVALARASVVKILLVVTFDGESPDIVSLMNEIVLHRKTDTIAILIGENDDPTTARPLATVYRLKDGWHMKATHRHDRFAWSGPFSTPDEALEHYTPIDATGPLLRLAV
jgi:hypothetical protein